MEVISRGPQFLFLNAGDVRLELIRKDAFEGDKRLGIPGVHHISFKVDNIEVATKELKEKRVKLLREPFAIREGLKLAFFDGLNNVNLQLFDDKR
jgi:hypothetical protein